MADEGGAFGAGARAGQSPSPTQRRLLEAARTAAARAYAPYSGFHVGAAARTADGGIHPGANLENESYGLSLCAETQALMAASFASDAPVVAIAVTGHHADGRIPLPLVTPCGRCRQLIAEAAARGRRDIEVIAATFDLATVAIHPIGTLLPLAFNLQSVTRP